MEPVDAKATAILSEEKMAPESSLTCADFISIAEKNLFHPEREILKTEKTVVPKPELTLYGTLIKDDLILPTLKTKEPHTQPQGGRNARQL